MDFSKSTRCDRIYQQRAKKLVSPQIYQTGNQYREQIKWLKSEYQKTRNQNRTLGNSSESCLFYEKFEQVLDTTPSMEQTMVHDDLVSQNGARPAHN